MGTEPRRSGRRGPSSPSHVAGIVRAQLRRDRDGGRYRGDSDDDVHGHDAPDWTQWRTTRIRKLDQRPAGRTATPTTLKGCLSLSASYSLAWTPGVAMCAVRPPVHEGGQLRLRLPDELGSGGHGSASSPDRRGRTTSSGRGLPTRTLAKRAPTTTTSTSATHGRGLLRRRPPTRRSRGTAIAPAHLLRAPRTSTPAP